MGMGKICILDMDLQGGQQMWGMFKEWQYVFIMAPSLGDLRARLQARGTEEQARIERRLVNAGKEMEKIK